MNCFAKNIVSLLSVLLIVPFFSSACVFGYSSRFETLTPKLQQLFIDEAKKFMEEGRERGYNFTLEEEVNKLLPWDTIVVPGKCENGKFTKLTTEDINSLGNLRFQILEFKRCDLTDVCFDGLFENILLFDIYFSLCEPCKEELKLSRKGWEWWGFKNFHLIGVNLEAYC